MKRCALCHGRLGLGARFRNLWNGRWWVHVRFCSVRCEGIYEVRRNEAAKHRWYTFLAGDKFAEQTDRPHCIDGSLTAAS